MHKRCDCECGGALLEAVIGLPFLLMVFFTTADMGNLLISYLKMGHLAGEGVRVATEAVGLEDGDNFSNLVLAGSQCFGGTPQDRCPQQKLLQNKINRLVVLYDLDLNDIDIRTGYKPKAGGSALDEQSVFVEISGRYRSITPFFRNLPLSNSYNAEYLFN